MLTYDTFWIIVGTQKNDFKNIQKKLEVCWSKKSASSRLGIANSVKKAANSHGCLPLSDWALLTSQLLFISTNYCGGCVNQSRASAVRCWRRGHDMSAYLIGYRSKLISLITKRSSYWIIVHKAFDWSRTEGGLFGFTWAWRIEAVGTKVSFFV